MLFNNLMPDYMLDSVYEVTPEFLQSIGKSVLISDIDDTLATYEESEPSQRLCQWFDSLRRAGIMIAFASNNSKSRVDRFNRKLGFFALHKSRKPSRRAVMKAMKHFDVLKDQVIFVGDQLFTDVLTAKHAGVTSVLVKPMSPPKNAFFKLKRRLERPLLSRFAKMHTERSQKFT